MGPAPQRPPRPGGGQTRPHAPRGAPPREDGPAARGLPRALGVQGPGYLGKRSGCVSQAVTPAGLRAPGRAGDGPACAHRRGAAVTVRAARPAGAGSCAVFLWSLQALGTFQNFPGVPLSSRSRAQPLGSGLDPVSGPRSRGGARPGLHPSAALVLTGSALPGPLPGAGVMVSRAPARPCWAAAPPPGLCGDVSAWMGRSCAPAPHSRGPRGPGWRPPSWAGCSVLGRPCPGPGFEFPVPAWAGLTRGNGHRCDLSRPSCRHGERFLSPGKSWKVLESSGKFQTARPG